MDRDTRQILQEINLAKLPNNHWLHPVLAEHTTLKGSEADLQCNILSHIIGSEGNVFMLEAADQPEKYRVISVRSNLRLYNGPASFNYFLAEENCQTYLKFAGYPYYAATLNWNHPVAHAIGTNTIADDGQFYRFERLLLPLKTKGESRLLVLSRENKDETGAASLSTRERQVLSLLMKGLPAKVIAVRLGLSTRTIEHHLERARRRLGARNAVQAAAIALGQPIDELQKA